MWDFISFLSTYRNIFIFFMFFWNILIDIKHGTYFKYCAKQQMRILINNEDKKILLGGVINVDCWMRSWKGPI